MNFPHSSFAGILIPKWISWEQHKYRWQDIIKPYVNVHVNSAKSIRLSFAARIPNGPSGHSTAPWIELQTGNQKPYALKLTRRLRRPVRALPVTPAVRGGNGMGHRSLRPPPPPHAPGFHGLPCLFSETDHRLVWFCSVWLGSLSLFSNLLCSDVWPMFLKHVVVHV